MNMTTLYSITLQAVLDVSARFPLWVYIRAREFVASKLGDSNIYIYISPPTPQRAVYTHSRMGALYERVRIKTRYRLHAQPTYAMDCLFV